MSEMVKESTDISLVNQDKESSLYNDKDIPIIRYQGTPPAHVLESVFIETIGQLRLSLLAIDPDKSSHTGLSDTVSRIRTLQGLLVRKLQPLVDSLEPIQTETLRPSHRIAREALMKLYDLAVETATWKIDDKLAESLGIELLSAVIETMGIVRKACVGQDKRMTEDG